MIKVLALLLILPIFSACQPGDTRPESSYYSTLPIGSSIILHRPLVVEVENFVVKIQKGKQAPKIGPFAFDPWCEFSLRERNMKAYTIQPATFTITRVVVHSSAILAQTPSSILVAGTGSQWHHLANGSAPWIQHYTDMYLTSKTETDVYLLSCQYTANQPATEYSLSVEEIIQTLTPLVTIERPAQLVKTTGQLK